MLAGLAACYSASPSCPSTTAPLLQDEPTSGLDSYTADMLMASLKTVAGAGRVVLASLHQPSRCALASSETACETAAAQRRLSGGAARVRLPGRELQAPIMTPMLNPRSLASPQGCLLLAGPSGADGPRPHALHGPAIRG